MDIAEIKQMLILLSVIFIPMLVIFVSYYLFMHNQEWVGKLVSKDLKSMIDSYCDYYEFVFDTNNGRKVIRVTEGWPYEKYCYLWKVGDDFKKEKGSFYPMPIDNSKS